MWVVRFADCQIFIFLTNFWVPPRGHSPRMRNGGSGDEGSLPNSFGCEFVLFIDVIKWKHVPRHWLLCGEFTGDCGEFTGHRWIPLAQTVTRSFDVFFNLRLDKRLSKQSRRRWFETPSHSLWRHCNDYHSFKDRVRFGTVWLGISVRKSPLFASFWFCTRNFRTDFVIHMQNHIPW